MFRSICVPLSLVIAAALLPGVVFAKKRDYVFEPATLAEVALKGTGLRAEQAIETVHRELLARYPGKLVSTRNWHMNVAGGAMGQLTVLYCSPREYLIFFGTPIGTEGFSGRYKKVDIWDFYMTGETWTYKEGDLEKQVHGPGSQTLLARGEAKGYKIPEQAWMLEYARGNIFSAFNFGVIAPTKNVTRDWRAAVGQLGDCIKMMTGKQNPPGN